MFSRVKRDRWETDADNKTDLGDHDQINDIRCRTWHEGEGLGTRLHVVNAPLKNQFSDTLSAPAFLSHPLASGLLILRNRLRSVGFQPHYEP